MGVLALDVQREPCQALEGRELAWLEEHAASDGRDEVHGDPDLDAAHGITGVR